MTSPSTDLVRTCRALAAAGLSPGTSGNASVRTRGGVLATASGAAFATLRRRDVVALADRAGRRPTKEAGMHVAVYDARDDVGAIVHLHSPAATALACLPAAAGDPLPAYTPYRIRLLGSVALVPYATPGSRRLAELAGVAASESRSLLLARHGLLVGGRDLAEAAAMAAEMEAACALALALAGTGAAELDPATAWSDD